MITVRAMQVKDAEQVSELERMIFSQPWSYQGFVDSLSLPNTVFLVAVTSSTMRNGISQNFNPLSPA